MPISLRDATPADLDAIFAIYDREVLDPFVDLATAHGAQVLWLGMPATDVHRQLSG